MAALWAFQVRARDASHVDVGWAYLLGFLALLDAALGSGSTAHRTLIAVLGGLWSLRLGTYLLLNRVLGREEDGRYRELRRRWGDRANSRFFVFFQAQALLDVIFSVPFLLVAFDGGAVEPLQWAGAALWLVGMVGESAADRQLAAWRAEPANRGLTCRAGLWRASRHPNYFFEWLNLGRVRPDRARRAVRLARTDRTGRDALLPLPRHRHPGDRGPGAAEQGRGLPPLPAGDERLRSVVPAAPLVRVILSTTC